VKILLAAGGNGFALPEAIWKVLFAIAVLTMFFGNMQALLADNLKRVMAYSSIAHSGYMLVALTVLAAGGALRDGNAASGDWSQQAIGGVLFYLAAYGIMNAGVFGVLMMLPSRRRVTDEDGNVRRLPATSAETYDDIAGTGRRYPMLAAAMAVCCISLIGIPLTVGFLGKLYILWPAVTLAGDPAVSDSGKLAMWWLVGLTVLNAAIGAAYYLRIISSMVLNPSPEQEDAEAEGRAYIPPPPPRQATPFVIATSLSVAGVLLFGLAIPAINVLNSRAQAASADVVRGGQMDLPMATGGAARSGARTPSQAIDVSLPAAPEH
jgi:NADH-quinone oxidoreductase subunit N